jgi:hypothetical protein
MFCRFFNSLLGKHLIVAVVWDLNNKEPQIRFFNLGSVQEHIIVEPHFIVQREHLVGNDPISGIFSSDLKPLLSSTGPALELANLLNTPVSKHMRKMESKTCG